MHSIITNDTDCFICGKRAIEKHHIFGGANRNNSTKYGLTVPLCNECHRGTKGVHNNRHLDLWLKRIAQQSFQYVNRKTKEDFRKIFSKNYL